MANTLFVEINKTNSYGEKGVAFVRTNDIVGIKELHVESEKLYDQDGNVVSETPKPRDFQVLVVGERGSEVTFHIDETEYQRLIALLNS